jgi:FkbM family methyltransferase
MLSKILHAYPFYSGCGFIANSPLTQRIAGASEGDAWARIRNGTRIRVRLSDFDGRSAYYTGDADRKVTWLLGQIVGPGDVVLDIGANIGLVTMTLSRLVGESGHVHSFEPNPTLQAYLDESLSCNKTANVTLHRFALGEVETTLELSVPKGHTGMGSLVERGILHEGADSIGVPVRPLSDVLKEIGVGRIRLVKIDVEGFEAQVIKGAERAFAANPPEAILMEHHPGSVPMSEHPAILGLKGLGYEFFQVPKRLLRVVVEPLTDGSAYTGHDVLAIHRGNAFAEIAQRIRLR